jgi:hypothetical protein
MRPGVRNEDNADIRHNSPRAQRSKDVIAGLGDSSFLQSISGFLHPWVARQFILLTKLVGRAFF